MPSRQLLDGSLEVNDGCLIRNIEPEEVDASIRKMIACFIGKQRRNGTYVATGILSYESLAYPAAATSIQDLATK
jgi:hypothetical protein